MKPSSYPLINSFFQTREEAISAVLKQQEDAGYVVRVDEIRDQSGVRIRCECCGKPAPKTVLSGRQRERKSKKTDCKWINRAHAISKPPVSHNHPPLAPEALQANPIVKKRKIGPQSNKLNDAIKKYSAANVNKDAIRFLITDDFGVNLSNKDIHNRLQKLQPPSGNQESIDSVVDFLQTKTRTHGWLKCI